MHEYPALQLSCLHVGGLSIMITKRKKYTKGRIAKPPTLTRIETLTKGLMLPPDEVRANFSIKEDEKGRGVYLKIPELKKGSFVLEYEGDVISPSEAKKREEIYASNGEGCFILEFRFKDDKMAIDATRNFDSYTRLLNHSRDPNIRFHSPIVVNFDGPPRIAAYALRDIKRGEEIVFDYGIKDRELPWLKNRENGFAEVTEDEFDEDESDKNSDASSGDYLCLRHTAARAGRLAGASEDRSFNYHEHSRSVSSSSGSSSKESRQYHHRTKRKQNAKQEKSGLSSDDKTSSTSSAQNMSLSRLQMQNVLTPGHLKHTTESRHLFTALGNGSYQVALDCLGVPQKILKCLEVRKSRKTEDSGSIICLSEVSSRSQETFSSNKDEPERLLDIPEVSSEKKVADWQTKQCIQIVSVQSLKDSPEQSPEPSSQRVKEFLSPVVLLENVKEVLPSYEKVPVVDSVTSEQTDRLTYIQTQKSLQDSLQLPHPTHESVLQTQCITSTSSSNLYSPYHFTNSNQQPSTSQSQQRSSNSTSELLLLSNSAHQGSAVNPVVPSASASSNATCIVSSAPLHQAQDNESLMVISDSEDQPPPMPLPAARSTNKSLSCPHKSQGQPFKEPIFFKTKSNHISPEHQDGLKVASPSFSVQPSTSQNTLNYAFDMSHNNLTGKMHTCEENMSSVQPDHNTGITSRVAHDGLMSQHFHVNQPTFKREAFHQSMPRDSEILQQQSVLEEGISLSQMNNSKETESFKSQHQRKNRLQQPTSSKIRQQQQNHVQSPPSEVPRCSQQSSPFSSKTNMPQNHVGHPLPRKSLLNGSWQSFPINTVQQQNHPRHQSSNKKLPQQKEQQCRSSPSSFSLHRHHNVTTASSVCRKQRPLNGQRTCAAHLSHKQSESIIILDDEDSVIECSREVSRKKDSQSWHCRLKEQDVLVLSSGDESDVDEVMPSLENIQATKFHRAGNGSAHKHGVSLNGFHENIKCDVNTDDTECELVLVEDPAPLRNDRGASSSSSSSSNKMAAIKRFNSDGCDKNDYLLNCGLTNTEMNHLSSIFDRHVFSTTVSKKDVNDKIYKHWKFFKSIVERGVSVEQIRAAVKVCFETCDRQFE